MRVVHLGTVVQVTFGVLDDDGNVIPQEPMQVRVAKFERDEFAAAFDAVAKARDDAAALEGGSS